LHSRLFFFEVGMLQISVSADADRLFAAVSKLRSDKLPRALMNAANELGRIVHGGTKGEGGLVGEMKKRFDRPTKWTLNSLRFKLATMDRPEVRIWIMDFAKKGASADEYLTPQIKGGQRGRKRHELKLISAGIMPADMWAVPASSAPLDIYGNVPMQFINRILHDVRAMGEQTAKRSYRKRTGWRRDNYFFAAPKAHSMHLRPGIYWHLSGAIMPVMIFTRSPSYTVRYPFYEIGRDIYNRNKDKVIARHLQAALSSNS
jgi:hypothetical protein